MMNKWMKVLVMTVALVVGPAVVSSAQIKVQVTDFGAFSQIKPNAGTYPRAGAGVLDVRVQSPPLTRSTFIDRGAGAIFGLSFVATGGKSGTPIGLRIVVEGPALASDGTGRPRYATFRLTVHPKTEHRVLIRLGPNDKPGRYRVRIFHRRAGLVNKEFVVK